MCITPYYAIFLNTIWRHIPKYMCGGAAKQFGVVVLVGVCICFVSLLSNPQKADCNTLRHNATRYNTVQHPATHCRPLESSLNYVRHNAIVRTLREEICCSVVHCVAVYCSQNYACHDSFVRTLREGVCFRVLQCVAV